MQPKRIQKVGMKAECPHSCSPLLAVTPHPLRERRAEEEGSQYHCKDSLARVGCFLPELNLASV